MKMWDEMLRAAVSSRRLAYMAGVPNGDCATKITFVMKTTAAFYAVTQEVIDALALVSLDRTAPSKPYHGNPFKFTLYEVAFEILYLGEEPTHASA